MPFRDLFGSPSSSSYAPDDPNNPKNYYKVVNDRRLADNAAQDRRMADAYAKGELKNHRPDEGGSETRIPGVISHNDALYFAGVSGWTHTERWRPSAADEAERMRREGGRHGEAREVEDVVGKGKGEDEIGFADREEEGSGERRRKKSVGAKVKSFVFGAAGVTKE